MGKVKGTSLASGHRCCQISEAGCEQWRCRSISKAARTCTHSHVLMHAHTHTHTGSIFGKGERSRPTPSTPRRLTLTHSAQKRSIRGVKREDKASVQPTKGLRLGPKRTLRCSPHPALSLQPAVHGRSGTPQPWRAPPFHPHALPYVRPRAAGSLCGSSYPRKGPRLQAPLLLLHRGSRAAGEPSSGAAAPRGLRGCGTGLGSCQLPYIFQYTNFSCHLASDKQRELNRAIH